VFSIAVKPTADAHFGAPFHLLAAAVCFLVFNKFPYRNIGTARRSGALQRCRFYMSLLSGWFLYSNERVALQRPTWGDVSYHLPAS